MAAAAEDEEGAMGDVVYAPAPTSAKWRRAWTADGSARSDPTGTEDSNDGRPLEDPGRWRSLSSPSWLGPERVGCKTKRSPFLPPPTSSCRWNLDRNHRTTYFETDYGFRRGLQGNCKIRYC